jgi:HAD superfamily hydrolase (TIGR01509 family)
MSILGVEDCFDGIVDVYAMQPFCKPNQEAYEIAMLSSNSSNPKSCALIDDSIRNLATAEEMGFLTILVGNNKTSPTQSRVLAEINELPKIAPEFWN